MGSSGRRHTIAVAPDRRRVSRLLCDVPGSELTQQRPPCVTRTFAPVPPLPASPIDAWDSHASWSTESAFAGATSAPTSMTRPAGVSGRRRLERAPARKKVIHQGARQHVLPIRLDGRDRRSGRRGAPERRLRGSLVDAVDRSRRGDFREWDEVRSWARTIGSRDPGLSAWAGQPGVRPPGGASGRRRRGCLGPRASTRSAFPSSGPWSPAPTGGVARAGTSLRWSSQR
jgi:hypothetical protein